jgi:hypothetical protein
LIIIDFRGSDRYRQLMSTPETPSPDQLPVQRIDHIHRIDQWYLTLRTAIRGGCTVLVFYLGFDALKTFAGESTRVEVAISLLLSVLAEMKVAFWISLAGAACAWGFVERTLRHRKVEQLQGRIKQLETMIDPDRSTSGLTPAGRTNPTDRRK